MGRLTLSRDDLADHTAFCEHAYQRVLIHRGSAFEALVLCWRSGQGSVIHDHAGSACVVRVVEGAATEIVFESSPCGRLAPTRSRTTRAGSISACSDGDIHQMTNLEPEGHDLITLHVYSPPLSRMRSYSIEETTLAGHDDLIASRPQTITSILAATGSDDPSVSTHHGESHGRIDPAHSLPAQDACCRGRRGRFLRHVGGRQPGEVGAGA